LGKRISPYVLWGPFAEKIRKKRKQRGGDPAHGSTAG